MYTCTGEALEWVRGIQLNPLTFREGFFKPSICWNIYKKNIFWHFQSLNWGNLALSQGGFEPVNPKSLRSPCSAYEKGGKFKSLMFLVLSLKNLFFWQNLEKPCIEPYSLHMNAGDKCIRGNVRSASQSVAKKLILCNKEVN